MGGQDGQSDHVHEFLVLQHALVLGGSFPDPLLELKGHLWRGEVRVARVGSG